MVTLQQQVMRELIEAKMKGFTAKPRVAVSLIRGCLLGLAVDVAVSASAAAQPAQNAGAQKPPLMDRGKEVALALSACPPSVAGKAAVAPNRRELLRVG